MEAAVVGPASRSRAIAGWAIVLAFIVGAFVFAGARVRDSVDGAFLSAERIRETRTLLFEATKGQLDEETGVRGFVSSHDPRFLEPYDAARRTLPATFERLSRAVGELGVPLASAAMRDAVAVNARWVATVATPLIAHPAANTLELQRAGKTLVDRFRADTDVVETELAERNDALRSRFALDTDALGLLIGGAALALFAAASIFVVLQMRALARLDRERRRADEGRLRERSLKAAYEAEKRVADTLQEAFIQRALPVIPSMVFSATYVPATEEAKVGGDWYDAFEVADQRILFTIGDIAGHGLEAAVAMSRVRNEVLSSALADPDPASILTRVNRRVLDEPAHSMVTAVIGVADASTYQFTFAVAGHPPPVLLEPGRPPRLLEFGNLPLGVSPKARYASHTIQSVPGAMLVLYTDGVIEHSRNIIEGERQLMRAIAALSDSADPATSIFEAVFRQKSVGDDVAILTVGFSMAKGSGMTISGEDGASAFAGRLNARERGVRDDAQSRRRAS